jgi:probable O-glycosylation ligase (exosortase A-associated)
MRDLVILVLFAAMLPAGALSMQVGAMIWAWIALVAPSDYAYGIASGLPYNKLAVAVTALSLIFGKTKNRFYIDTNFVLLTSFVVVCMIAFALGVSDINRTYVLADRLVKIYALCVVMMACIQTRQHIHGMLMAICLGTGIHGVLEGLKYIVTAGGHILIGPHAFGDNNNFGLVVLMTIPLLIYCCRYAAHPLTRLALLFATVINLVAVIATASRGALLGLIAVSIGIAMRSNRKASALLIIALGGCLVVAFAPDRWTKRMDTISTAEQDDSFMSRVISWKLNTVLAVERPFGAGFSGLEDRRVWEAYRYKVNTTIPFFDVPAPTTMIAAHSIYFEALGDNGFLGLGLFLGLLFNAFANLRAVRRMARGHKDLVWAYDLANTFWIALIAYVVAGAALSMTYFEMFYMIIMLISILRRNVADTLGARLPATGVARINSGGALAGAMSRTGT